MLPKPRMRHNSRCPPPEDAHDYYTDELLAMLDEEIAAPDTPAPAATKAVPARRIPLKQIS